MSIKYDYDFDPERDSVTARDRDVIVSASRYGGTMSITISSADGSFFYSPKCNDAGVITEHIQAPDYVKEFAEQVAWDLYDGALLDDYNTRKHFEFEERAIAEREEELSHRYDRPLEDYEVQWMQDEYRRSNKKQWNRDNAARQWLIGDRLRARKDQRGKK